MRRFFLLFFIKRTKKLSNGECPIYCRLTLDGHRAEFGTKVSSDEDSWNAATGKAAGKSQKAYVVNNELEDIRNQITKIEREYELRGMPLSADQIKNEILGINKQSLGLVEAFTEHNKKIKVTTQVPFFDKICSN